MLTLATCSIFALNVRGLRDIFGEIMCTTGRIVGLDRNLRIRGVLIVSSLSEIAIFQFSLPSMSESGSVMIGGRSHT